MFYSTDAQFHITEFLNAVLDRRFAKDFSFDGENHNFWELVYVLEGKIVVTEDEKVYVLGEQDIVFHAPYEFHRIRSAENTTPRVLNISFRASGTIPEHLKGGVMHLSSALHQEYIDIIDMLRQCISDKEKDYEGPTTLFETGCRLSAFFLRLSRENHVKDSFSTSASAKTYSRLVEMMHKEVCSNLSLEAFAKRNFISVSYLKKLFKEYAGISPKNYYTQLRVSEAQRLLCTDTTISDISEKMNFSSTSYFTQFFKSHANCTPIQYRKAH